MNLELEKAKELAFLRGQENCLQLLFIIEMLHDALLEETTKNIPNDKKRYERTRAALALVERS